jgi:FkbM family methyltransferase
MSEVLVFNTENAMKSFQVQKMEHAGPNGKYLDNLSPLTGDDNARDMYNRLKAIQDKIDFSQIKTIFDIGSRDIKESITLAKTFTEAKVYAFEPTPENIVMCQNNYADLSADLKYRISLIRSAMNDTTGKIKFYPLDEQNSRSKNFGVASKFKLIDGLNGTFLGEHWVQKEVEVDAYAMDDFCKENNIEGPDLIWMDVQGAELDVLKGGKNSILNTKIIMTEAGSKAYYDGHALHPDIDKYLTDKGFVEVKEVRKYCHEYEFDVVYVNTKFFKV